VPGWNPGDDGTNPVGQAAIIPARYVTKSIAFYFYFKSNIVDPHHFAGSEISASLVEMDPDSTNYRGLCRSVELTSWSAKIIKI
jgi:hypothetical protein